MHASEKDVASTRLNIYFLCNRSSYIMGRWTLSVTSLGRKKCWPEQIGLGNKSSIEAKERPFGSTMRYTVGLVYSRNHPSILGFFCYIPKKATHFYIHICTQCTGCWVSHNTWRYKNALGRPKVLTP
jgi:hypothetical protein